MFFFYQWILSAPVPIPGRPDYTGLFRLPVLYTLAGAAVVIILISAVSVIRRK